MNADADAYRSLRMTTIALARSRADDLDDVAPAVPEWRVRDVLAHLGGVSDDLVHGNLDGVGTDPWTAVQVEKRLAWSVEEVLVDWEQHGDAVDAMIDEAPDGAFGQLLYDAWTHEQDLRGALAAPGGRDTVAARRAYEWGTDAFDLRDQAAERPALELSTEHGARAVGVGDPSERVRASRFELLRAMTGRRSVGQMRGYDWSGEPDPERLVLAPIFHPPVEDLQE